MKSQTASLYSLPVSNFGFLTALVEAMPIVIFFKAMQEAAKGRAQSIKTGR